jgi:hypothetical protein
VAFQQFQQLASNKLKFGFFMFMKLPSAFFCGVRLRSISEAEAVVSVPYKWLSQNPFSSIYFACQAMAAEMSTGVLALGHIHGRKPGVSMLVTRLEAVFVKKGTERIYFSCKDGLAMQQCIEEAIASGEGKTFIASSVGRTKNGEVVSEFKVEWSFKSKSYASA